MPTTEKYTKTAIWLHWIIAALIVGNTALALGVDHWPDDWVRPVIDTHKSIGITALGLIVLRILWRAGHAPPPLPTAYAAWERSAAHVAHAALYLLILALPLSGWMHDSAWKDAATHPMFLFGAVPFPRMGWIEAIEPVMREHLHDVFGAAHRWIGYALDALLAAHVLAALKHQFVDRESELQRIWPG